MCGIAGIINSKGHDIAALDLQMMATSMDHRGPDDMGFLGWQAGHDICINRNAATAIQGSQVAFAHLRLSIIDEGEGGWQPMATENGNFAITFNGEIYNYVELKSELEAEGITFATSSDTEVLLHALATWGVEKTLPKLVGMFAFALLDVQSGTVTLGRDPFGIKPLCYTVRKGGLAFASELTSLLMLSGVKRDVEPQALYDYLRFGFTDRGARTLFASIKHLPPAHFAVINLDEPSLVMPQKYWQAELKPILDVSFEDATAKLKSLFVESVKLHLRADVPVGAALSGGIDSSSVVGVMREIEGADLDLHTFTFIAPGDDMNEEKWADMAATQAQATQHKVSLSGKDLVQEIDSLIQTQGEPFGSTSIFAQNRVFKLAHDHGIKVTLDGQGADEILGGYIPFLAARLATLIKSGQWIKAVRLLQAIDGKRGTFLRALRFILPPILQNPARRLIGESVVPAWMNGAWFAHHGVVMQAPQKPVRGDVLRHELLESLTDRILPALLRYQDRNSMAHSVESRVPFLTTALVDFLYSLPEDFLISDEGETKSIFRAAMRGLAPDAILDRRDKIGFAAPEETWLKEMDTWLDDVLSYDLIKTIPAFDNAVMAHELSLVKAGKKPLTGEVWRWINLVRWAETFDVKFMTDSKKITYVSPEPERQGHASYTHVHEIINGLKDLGWTVELFCPHYDEAKLPGAVSRLVGIGKTILKAVMAPRPKAYYMRWHFAVFPVALFAKILSIPTIIEVNGPVDDLFIAWPITRKFRTLFTWFMTSQLRWAGAIVAVTQGLAEMSRDISDAGKPIVVIPNGANTDKFSPKAAQHKTANTHMLPEKFMVFFGTMAPWQGIRTVLKAIEDPAWPEGVHAVFVGDGVERPAVEALSSRLDHVHYLGRVPYDELPSVVARALGSFVCTENLEGRASTGLAPLKLFESLACGVPVIATDMPFQADVVRDGGCGYVIEAGDVEGLAKTVAKLMDNPAKGDEMSQKARLVAVNDHSWKARAKDTQTVLLSVLKS